MIIAIDFDGTCVKHAYPAVGADVGAVPVLRALGAAGHQLSLYTMRSGQHLKDAEIWFAENNISLGGVNSNPEQHTWSLSPKVYAQLYIDDAALGVPLTRVPGERPWVDWFQVSVWLVAQNVLPAHYARRVEG